MHSKHGLKVHTPDSLFLRLATTSLLLLQSCYSLQEGPSGTKPGTYMAQLVHLFREWNGIASKTSNSKSNINGINLRRKKSKHSCECKIFH